MREEKLEIVEKVEFLDKGKQKMNKRNYLNSVSCYNCNFINFSINNSKFSIIRKRHI